MSPIPNFPLCGKGGYANTNDGEIPLSFLREKPPILKLVALAEFYGVVVGEYLRISGKKGSCNRQIDTASNFMLWETT
jgi:hypothetical protein